MTTTWARAGVRAWAKLLDGVNVEPDTWLVEADGERFLLSWRSGRVYLTVVEVEFEAVETPDA